MDTQAEGHESFLQRRALAALAKKLPAKAVVRRALVASERAREGLLIATNEHIAWARKRIIGHRVTIVAIKAARLAVETRGRWSQVAVTGGRRPFAVSAPAPRAIRFVEYVEATKDGRVEPEEPDHSQRIDRLLARGSMSKGEAEWAWRAGR